MSNELTFVAKIISDNRVTIDKDVCTELDLQPGDRVSIKILKLSSSKTIEQGVPAQ